MSYFVTGTDTHIGKTFISCLLCIKTGFQYWKPIQSGINPITDSQWISKYIDKKKIITEVYRLKQSVSPDYAASLENIKINIDQIIKKRPTGNSIIEGAGGLYVPINDNQLQIELIKELKFEVILVARGTLGTINHTLLSIDALRKYQIPIFGIVINGEVQNNSIEAITKFSHIKILGQIPKLKKINKQQLLSTSKNIQLG